MVLSKKSRFISTGPYKTGGHELVRNLSSICMVWSSHIKRKHLYTLITSPRTHAGPIVRSSTMHHCSAPSSPTGHFFFSASSFLHFLPAATTSFLFLFNPPSTIIYSFLVFPSSSPSLSHCFQSERTGLVRALYRSNTRDDIPWFSRSKKQKRERNLSIGIAWQEYNKKRDLPVQLDSC